MADIITDYEKLCYRVNETDIKHDNAKLRDTVVKLKSTMRENNLATLSAPQIGEDVRVFCMQFEDGVITSFVNPIYTHVEGLTLSRETCSSIPGKTYLCPRYTNIEIVYSTPLGEPQAKKLVGLAAFKFQHQLEHLEGVLISDIGLEIDEDFDNATEDEQAEIIKMYLDSLDIKLAGLKEEIQTNDELSQMNGAINLLEQVQQGKAHIEAVPVIIKKDEPNEDNKNDRE